MATDLAKAFYNRGKVILVEPLGSQVKLGSVGYLADGQWVEIGTTKSMFGLRLPQSSPDSTANSFDGKGGKGLKFELKLAGETSTLVPKAADAKARAEITFGSKGAFVMNVKNQVVSRAEGLADLIAAIRFGYKYRRTLPEGQRWEKHYAVIVGLADAESVTALASTSSNASVVVNGSASFAAPAAPAQLEARMSVSFSTESVDKLWQGPARGYAFQALRISPSVFKAWDRQDVVSVRPADSLSFSESPEPHPVKRPRSFSGWARKTNMAPEAVRVELLRPSGTAAAKGVVGTLLRRQPAATRNGRRRARRHPRG